MNAWNLWAMNLAMRAQDTVIAAKDQLAAMAGPVIAEPLWSATSAICRANLLVFKWGLVNLSHPAVRKGLLYEYKPVHDPARPDGEEVTYP